MTLPERNLQSAYRGRYLKDIIEDFVLVRGDLSEQYARRQLCEAVLVSTEVDEVYKAATEALDLQKRVDRHLALTPIVQAAIAALLEFEQEHLMEMGYDILYAQEDMPKVVAEAIKPWAEASALSREPTISLKEAALRLGIDPDEIKPPPDGLAAFQDQKDIPDALSSFIAGLLNISDSPNVIAALHGAFGGEQPEKCRWWSKRHIWRFSGEKGHVATGQIIERTLVCRRCSTGISVNVSGAMNTWSFASRVGR